MRPTRVLAVAAAVILIALGPALVAVLAEPGFLTQDGPAHVYNAAVVGASRDVASPLRAAFEIRPEIAPNSAAHLLLVASLPVLGPEGAGRVLTALTLAAIAAATLVLRSRVAGRPGLAAAALAAAFLALNVTWLLGFASFLLGTVLFAATLALLVRGRPTPGRAVCLALLLVIGYLCHPVTLAATFLGAILLAIAAPDREPGSQRWPRVIELAVATLPLVPLGLVYLKALRGASPMVPAWASLADPTSLAAWSHHLRFVDPFTLTGPDRSWGPYWSVALGLPPIVFAAAGLALLALRRRRGSIHAVAEPPRRPVPHGSRRAILLLAAILLGLGLVGPDGAGAEHLDYLPQRLILLGAVALIAAADIRTAGLRGRAGIALLVIALALQSAVVWRYGELSRAVAGDLERVRPGLPRGSRLAGLVLDPPASGFRASPLLHADALLAAETESVLWSDYEAVSYHFPVRYRRGLAQPPPLAFEWLAHAGGSGERFSPWARLLERHGAAIDALVVWGEDRSIEALNERLFVEAARGLRTRLLLHRPMAAPAFGSESPAGRASERLGLRRPGNREANAPPGEDGS